MSNKAEKIADQMDTIMLSWLTDGIPVVDNGIPVVDGNKCQLYRPIVPTEMRIILDRVKQCGITPGTGGGTVSDIVQELMKQGHGDKLPDNSDD